MAEAVAQPQTPQAPTLQPESTLSPVSPRRRSWKWGKRDSLNKRLSIGNPGSRRYQRNWNRLFLEGKFATFSEEEKLHLFRIEWRSGFATLWEDPANMAIWEKFMLLSEDEQNSFLTILSENDESNETNETNDARDESENLTGESRDDVEQDGEWDTVDPDEDEEFWITIDSASQFNELDADMKATLKEAYRMPFVEILDAQMQEFVHSSAQSITIQFEDSYQRKICHGFAQFYGLNSHSKTTRRHARVTVIRKPRIYTTIPDLPLFEFMQSTF